jgi:hypothetical protein
VSLPCLVPFSSDFTRREHGLPDGRIQRARDGCYHTTTPWKEDAGTVAHQ